MKAQESLVLGNILKAYGAAELKTKLDALESVIGGRRQWQKT